MQAKVSDLWVEESPPSKKTSYERKGKKEDGAEEAWYCEYRNKHIREKETIDIDQTSK